MKWVMVLLIILTVGCSTKPEVQYIGLSARDKQCLSRMEWAMRNMDHYLERLSIPIEVQKQWIETKYYCWKEGPVD